ncbi:alpha/beta hydrolase [Antarcticibacterium sp. 1MA-6-2]|uniref:alpha/beta hydrolase n=1 Tax=Antarcticibacterium sp. 1MA-6-2 TaxID=2908210 RepID=UPI001F22B365|nr:alpha/beta hydrolase [Antarcticibacterium sp. 1MA-6-2]UJH90295.1 alpha/beta hydrolase [Antarcticibacterium sp. 1MA-6-2]
MKISLAKETWFRQWGDPMARNISTATLTPFLPDPAIANGTTVIVAPGGGFRWLSMGNEGWEVAEALAKKGIAAFVLKYRLNPTPESLEDFKTSMTRPPSPPAGSSNGAPVPPQRPRSNLSNQLEDAEAAYALIVKRAEEWGVDTTNIGMMGFSAGAKSHNAFNAQFQNYGSCFYCSNLWRIKCSRGAKKCSPNV